MVTNNFPIHTGKNSHILKHGLDTRMATIINHGYFCSARRVIEEKNRKLPFPITLPREKKFLLFHVPLLPPLQHPSIYTPQLSVLDLNRKNISVLSSRSTKCPLHSLQTLKYLGFV
ncbi:hypothetical protein KIL84_018488 [Mauremys mutica]|uniref:Uncharacterized protein n=1 Tax=Mauremys mutica TaxID=74926 RepID=A0A9D3XQF8_9SAUR|nr:hypothetical protein KIL84_018488 [Mauremys mutica]